MVASEEKNAKKLKGNITVIDIKYTDTWKYFSDIL